MDTKGQLVIGKLSTAAVPEAVKHLRSQLVGLLPQPQLTELLIEVDRWASFSDQLTHAGGKTHRDPQLRRNLYAAILAQACNFGLTALADHLTTHGIVLEMLTGPLPGIYDPRGSGRMLFAFFAAMAETERENIRESTLEGLDAAARRGKHGGRRPVITEDMLHTVLRRRACGESIQDIRTDLIISAGKHKGRNPSLASIYRALAEHQRREAFPEAVAAAHTEFAELHAGSRG